MVKSVYELIGPSGPALISSFCTMKQLGAFLFPPGLDASQSQRYP